MQSDIFQCRTDEWLRTKIGFELLFAGKRIEAEFNLERNQNVNSCGVDFVDDFLCSTFIECNKSMANVCFVKYDPT